MNQELTQLETLIQTLSEKYQQAIVENTRQTQRIRALEEEKRMLADSSSNALADMEKTHIERLKDLQDEHEQWRNQHDHESAQLRQDNESLLMALKRNADEIRAVLEKMAHANNSFEQSLNNL